MAIDWENYGRDRYGNGLDGEDSYSYQRDFSEVRRYDDYVEGNTVRKMNALPERRDRKSVV